jgi:hypothetical protein
MKYRNMKPNVMLFVYNHLLHLILLMDLQGKLRTEEEEKNKIDRNYFSVVRNS